MGSWAGRLNSELHDSLVPLPTFRYYDSTLQTCQSILLWSTTDKWIPRLPQFYICMYISFNPKAIPAQGQISFHFPFFNVFSHMEKVKRVHFCGVELVGYALLAVESPCRFTTPLLTLSKQPPKLPLHETICQLVQFLCQKTIKMTQFIHLWGFLSLSQQVKRQSSSKAKSNIERMSFKNGPIYHFGATNLPL